MSRNPGMMKVACLCLSLVCLTSCTRLSEKPNVAQLQPLSVPDEAVVVKNEGRVCFEEFDNSLELRGHFSPKGCFSSSCTRPIEQSFVVRVDTEQYTIRLYANFVLVDPYGSEPHRCTADCGGAGGIDFDIGDVERGTYSIWLGEMRLGELTVPPESLTGHDICFGEPW